MDAPLYILLLKTLIHSAQGNSHLGAALKLCRLRGEGAGQNLPILLGKKTTKREGGKNANFEMT